MTNLRKRHQNARFLATVDQSADAAAIDTFLQAVATQQAALTQAVSDLAGVVQSSVALSAEEESTVNDAVAAIETPGAPTYTPRGT